MFDADGFLTNSLAWDEELAVFIAKKENIILTQEHWEVLYLIREFYSEFKIQPPVRILVKMMATKYDETKGTSRYLYRLFPHGPARQATKIAGLPKSANCV